MPLSKFAFIGSTIVGILVGFAALLAIVATTLWLVCETRSNAATVADATLMRNALVVLLSDAQDAETGQRGFLLTDDRAYLAPYRKALQEIGPQLDQVRAHLMKNDAEEQSLLDRLAKALNDKLAELNDTINLVSAGRRDEALSVVKTDRGRVLMDEAREIFRRLITRANAYPDNATGEIRVIFREIGNGSFKLRLKTTAWAGWERRRHGEQELEAAS